MDKKNQATISLKQLSNTLSKHRKHLLALKSDRDHQFSTEAIKEAAQYVSQRLPRQPCFGIICGTGVGAIGEVIADQITIPYEEIPYFPVSTVKGHSGQLVFGYLHGVPIIAMQGRFHYYEGYSMWKCTMPVRVLKCLGIKYLIVTNAAGALNTDFKIGDIMIIRDHFSVQQMSGLNPLRGPNDETFGERFPSMVNAYDKDLAEIGRKVAKDMEIEDIIQEGVYTTGGGPSYETCHEIKVLKMFGCDAVGMSTIPEVIVARHCGLKVFAFSVITNVTVTDSCGAEPNHEEVLETGRVREPILKAFVGNVVKGIFESDLELMADVKLKVK